MAAFEQRRFFNSMITVLIKQYLDSTVDEKNEESLKPRPVISGPASLVHQFIRDNDVLKEHVLGLLTNSPLPALDDSLGGRRGVVAAISQNKGL